jgi:putative transcriptional regulator
MSYHPPISLLAAYADGSIDAAQGLVVATHLDICACCREQVRKNEEYLANQVFSSSKSSISEAPSTMTGMLADIMALPQDVAPSPPSHESKICKVEVNGQSITIPRRLSKFIEKSRWKSYAGKVFSQSLDVDGEAKVSLMYMAKNVSVPQHTHKGTEFTLVLHGGFSDDSGYYGVGDFIERDASIRHSPATGHEDCLCLTLLTEPMLFTQGVARVFNLFGKGLYP